MRKRESICINYWRNIVRRRTKAGLCGVVATCLVVLLCLPMLWAAPGDEHKSDSKYGQFAPADAFRDGSPLAYYGSENQWSRRQFSKTKADRDYKRRGQRQILATIDGDPEQSILWAQSRLDADPDDLEALFNQVVAWCEFEKVEKAIAPLQEALAKGLPLERFLAGPRHLLQPLYETQEFQALLAKQPIQLIHGPMLGDVTENSAKVWVRTVDENLVTVRASAKFKRGSSIRSVEYGGEAKSRAEYDFTAVVEMVGLVPDTEYSYDVLIDGKSVLKGERPQFKTRCRRGESTQIKIAFGGGAGFNPHLERMWDTIADYQPDSLFLLGDNVYIDLAEEPRGLHRYTYYRRQSRPEFRRLVGSTSVYAIWDDHDCGIDDVWMGPYVDRPIWKPSMLTVFKENWVNPAYGNRAAPGCWFDISIGDVDFFFLDTRNYRTNPFGEKPTMLGPVQKAWFLDAVKKSTAEFKVLVSSVPWAPEAKPGSNDTWDGFKAEREEIFSMLEENKIEGVLLLSADRHRSDAWKIERTNGYPLYDMMSSKITNMHTHECFPNALFCYNGGCSFGLLTIDTTEDDPTATYEVVDIEGKVVHRLPLKKSELSY